MDFGFPGLVNGADGDGDDNRQQRIYDAANDITTFVVASLNFQLLTMPSP